VTETWRKMAASSRKNIGKTAGFFCRKTDEDIVSSLGKIVDLKWGK
jgi:hypothetical protein